METEEPCKLTKYPEGSIKELLVFSFPLMLCLLSENIMLFIDRLILARYSLDAMNAATAASFFCCILQFGSVGIATIAEVFVGQFNSSKMFKKTAQPAWQMLWFALFSSIIFFSVAKWGGNYLLSPYYLQEHGLPYFKWLLYFGPFFPMLAALSAFFIGIGRAKLITTVIVIGNITNIVLDIILIFGIPGLIPSMGTKGAAIATGVSQGLQVIVVLFFFFNSYYRNKYNTTDYKFRKSLFFKCIKLGSPNACGFMLEMASWAIIARMMGSLGETYLTVMTVGQSLYSLIEFSLEGLQRGISIISANFLAVKKWDKVNKIWQSGSKSIFMLAAIFSIFMVFYPAPLIKLFLISEVSSENYEHVFNLLRVSSIAIWLYIFFDGHSSVSTGILLASGDTFYILAAYICYVCFLTFLPIFVLTHYFHFSPLVIWATVCYASFVHSLFNFIRFKQNIWKTKKPIIDDY